MALLHATHQIIFHNPGREDDEEAETLELQHVAFWTAAAPKLSRRTYEHKGCRISIELDWTPLCHRLTQNHNLGISLRTGQLTWKEWSAKQAPLLAITAHTEIEGENHLSNYEWYSGFFVEYYLYEIFTVANLACPGAAEFFNIEIYSRESAKGTKLGLSAFYFDNWAVESVQGAKPAAKVLPVDLAIAWYHSANPRVTQKAESSIQCTLYALYELCRNDGKIDFVIWLFHALGSLFSTRFGEGISTIAGRASLILGFDEKEKETLKMKLGELYKLRNKFAHWGYKLPHPLHYETIDERINSDYSKLLELGAYGFSVLAALLQEMVERNIYELRFEERLIVE